MVVNFWGFYFLVGSCCFSCFLPSISLIGCEENMGCDIFSYQASGRIGFWV
jgi:hypothetical protein